jgi:predicted  nucleic acid-binding Zn-ribbon protein
MPRVIIETDDLAATFAELASQPVQVGCIAEDYERLKRMCQGWDDEGETPVEAVDRLNREVLDARKKLKAKDEEIAEVIRQVGARDTTNRELRKIIDERTLELGAATGEVDKLAADKRVLHQQLAAAGSTMNSSCEERQRLRKRVEELDAIILQLRKDALAHKHRLAAKQNVGEAHEAVQDEADAAIAALQRALKQANSKNLELENELSDARNLIIAVQDERAELRNGKVASNNAISALAQSLADAKAKIKIYEGAPDEVPPASGRPGDNYQRQIAYLSDVVGCYKGKLEAMSRLTSDAVAVECGATVAGLRASIAQVANDLAILSAAIHEKNGTTPFTKP